MEIFRILLRTFIGYFILVAMLKIMGKREIGQLSLFDLIIFLSIADIMVIGIENYELNYLYVILPIILVTLLQKVIAFLILKFTSLRKVFDGKESIIIYKGKVNIKEMKKLCYNFDDLISDIAMREADMNIQIISPDLRCMGYYSAYNEMYNTITDKSIKVINCLDNDIFLPIGILYLFYWNTIKKTKLGKNFIINCWFIIICFPII